MTFCELYIQGCTIYAVPNLQYAKLFSRLMQSKIQYFAITIFYEL